MGRPSARIAALVVGLVGRTLAGCGGEDLAAPHAGTLEVRTATTGPRSDADGYRVTLDGAPRAPVPANGTVALTEVGPGAHSVGLDAASIAPGCTVDGANPRPATIQSDETTRVAFTVACAAIGNAPAITAVRGPEVADNAPGTVTDFVVGFSDPDGDIARLTVVADTDPANAIEPDSVEVDTRGSLRGQTSGELAYHVTCGAISPNLCGAGPVTLRFQLTDDAGNRSEPRSFGLHYGIGNSPVIAALDAPAQAGTARGTRTRIRLAFADPDGDLRKVRLQELSDTNDVIHADGDVDVAAEAGSQTSGTVTLDFVCLAPLGHVCPAGTATLRFVLVDAESNTSRPAEATIVFGATAPMGAAPAITTLDVPATIATTAGTRADFVVGFADPDGDVTTLRIEEAADPSDAFPGDVDLDILAQTDGRDSGTVRETLACTLPAGAECPAGRVTLRFTLLDAAGHASAPREATVAFVSPAPTSARGRGAYALLSPPAHGDTANEKAPEARLRRLSLK